MKESHCRTERGSAAVFYLLAATLFGFPFFSSAQDGSGESAEPDQSAVAKKAMKRDPFWPVGYVPESEKVKEPVKNSDDVKIDWASAEKALRINGIGSRDGAVYALINGQIKVVGERLAVMLNNVVYTWEVESINPPGTVKLRQVSAE
ncbi:MAG: hypothetical protein JXR40_09000 [Pontiellaceae bacterium]|nr:hypothetical protein [Pontiellaceae bacterium]